MSKEAKNNNVLIPTLAGVAAAIIGMMVLAYFNAEEWEIIFLSLGLGIMVYKVVAGIKL